MIAGMLLGAALASPVDACVDMSPGQCLDHIRDQGDAELLLVAYADFCHRGYAPACAYTGRKLFERFHADERDFARVTRWHLKGCGDNESTACWQPSLLWLAGPESGWGRSANHASIACRTGLPEYCRLELEVRIALGEAVAPERLQEAIDNDPDRIFRDGVPLREWVEIELFSDLVE